MAPPRRDRSAPDPFSDERQPILFDALPLPPVKRSDERALAEARALLATLRAAKTHPWSERLLGWQQRRLATFAALLTPEDAATLTASFEAELTRLGPPRDIWAELGED